MVFRRKGAHSDMDRIRIRSCLTRRRGVLNSDLIARLEGVQQLGCHFVTPCLCTAGGHIQRGGWFIHVLWVACPTTLIGGHPRYLSLRLLPPMAMFVTHGCQGNCKIWLLRCCSSRMSEPWISLYEEAPSFLCLRLYALNLRLRAISA